MGKAIEIADHWTAVQLRRLASGFRHANQSRRLLSSVGVLDGMNRTEAAKIGGAAVAESAWTDQITIFQDCQIERIRGREVSAQLGCGQYSRRLAMKNLEVIRHVHPNECYIQWQVQRVISDDPIIEDCECRQLGLGGDQHHR